MYLVYFRNTSSHKTYKCQKRSNRHCHPARKSLHALHVLYLSTTAWNVCANNYIKTKNFFFVISGVCYTYIHVPTPSVINRINTYRVSCVCFIPNYQRDVYVPNISDIINIIAVLWPLTIWTHKTIDDSRAECILNVFTASDVYKLSYWKAKATNPQNKNTCRIKNTITIYNIYKMFSTSIATKRSVFFFYTYIRLRLSYILYHWTRTWLLNPKLIRIWNPTPPLIEIYNTYIF